MYNGWIVATTRQTRLKQSNVLYGLACTFYEYVSPGIFSIAVMNFPMNTKMMLYFFAVLFWIFAFLR